MVSKIPVPFGQQTCAPNTLFQPMAELIFSYLLKCPLQHIPTIVSFERFIKNTASYILFTDVQPVTEYNSAFPRIYHLSIEFNQLRLALSPPKDAIPKEIWLRCTTVPVPALLQVEPVFLSKRYPTSLCPIIRTLLSPSLPIHAFRSLCPTCACSFICNILS